MNSHIVRTLLILIGCLLLFQASACTGSPAAALTQTAQIPAPPPSSTPEPTSVVLVPPTRTPSQATQPTADLPTPTPDDGPGANDNPYYYGGLVITIDNVGQTIAMKPKGSFMLSLGENYDWTVEVDPPDVLSLNLKITPDPGQQGVFIARQRGKATLRAVGNPLCRTANPPCARPSLLFTLDILVQ